MKKSILYVVTAIDAEGPIDDPTKSDILNTWDRVDELLDRLFSRAFRESITDTTGNGAIISWFILTLTGFKTNPFHRPMEYHQTYDHYINRYADRVKYHNDGIYWHYHQPAKSGIGNDWCSDWVHTNEYDNILARLLIERHYFPSCFRAGGRIENDDTSWWLEEIIPFDFSSCSGNINWDNIESNGRPLRAVSDWSRAPADWSWYHPSPGDYQQNGNQQRFIFRCPDLASPVHTLDDDDIRRAFDRVHQGKDSILAFFGHDRRDIIHDSLLDVYSRVRAIGEQYPNVEWRFANAQKAAMEATGLKHGIVPSFDIEKRTDKRLLILANCPVFGRAPFVAASNSNGSICRRIGLVTAGQYKWLTDPLPAEISQAAVAAANASGEIGTSVFELT